MIFLITLLILSPLFYMAWYTERLHKQNRCNHTIFKDDKCVRCNKEQNKI